jgi:hypothetical protein
MTTKSNNQDREEKIADIIREYSKGDVDREWLFTRNKDMDNGFKKSFHAINDRTSDVDLSLWYLAFGQSFGRKTDFMHRKMAELCTSEDLELITFKKDLPPGCPYAARKLINEFPLPFRTEPKIFFYYDSLCLLNNAAVSSFNELFLKINALTDDSNKRTIVIKALLEQIRGIATKTLMFLQWENIFNKRDLDYFELIFVDLHAVRVAKNMGFPFYEDDLVDALKKFSEKYDLTARQMDLALWEMGFLCTDERCLRDEEQRCIFYDVCPLATKE